MADADPSRRDGAAADRIAGEVRALVAAWRAGTPDDPALRTRLRQRIDALRDLYRRHARAFTADDVASLRAIAQALGDPRPRPANGLRSSRHPARSASPSARASASPLMRPRPTTTPEAVLRSVFGYASFRPGQREIIDAVLAGRDCVGVMPTGAGKSLTYQIPARILGGTTLVVSPLIALMKDQVDAVRELGLRATFLNSSLDPDERRARVDGLRRGDYELVYAAPEGIESSVGNALARAQLRLIAVDEAHCISHWGHDFRPAYRNLADLKHRFGDIPVLALTATATAAVTDDIVRQLAMERPAHFRGSFFRKNLRIHIYKKGDELGRSVGRAILDVVRARRGQAGIVYCLSRKSVEKTAESLREHGIAALPYHAGMESDERARVQDAFRRDDIDVIVATIAFGMGIDKPNIRYVVHRDMPRSIEAYYQEIGRAGRDGAPSDCVLFYSWADVAAYDRFAEESEMAEAHKRLVREMYDYADRDVCRHRALVRHFGEHIDDCESACDVCLGERRLGPPAGEARGALEARTATRGPRARRGGLDGASAAGSTALAAGPDDGGESDGLIVRLKQLRKRIADEKKIPAFVVFSDYTLLEMARLRPQSDEELLAVSGVGPKKLAQYGEAFLALLSRG